MGLKHSPGPWRQSHPGNRITSILDADGALVVAGEEDGAMTLGTDTGGLITVRRLITLQSRPRLTRLLQGLRRGQYNAITK